MTVALVASVLGIALVDAINPSALAMTAYLLTLDDPWARLWAYLSGIGLLYLAIGCVVVFVLGSGVARAVEALSSPAAGTGFQALVGVAAIGLGVRRLRRCRQGPAAVTTPAVPTVARAFLLGLVVTAVEATTALPYLGALALLVGAEASAPSTVAVLMAYTAVFVSPPIVLALASRTGAGRRVMDRLRRPRRRRPALSSAVASAGLLVGVALLLHAAASILSRSGWVPT